MARWFAWLAVFPFGALADCVDLSHQYEQRGATLRVTQLGCERLERRSFFGGEQTGEPILSDLDGQWKSDRVDDEHEAFDRRVRWSWNEDRSSILMESSVYTLHKRSGDRSRRIVAEVYRKQGGGVRIESTVRLREEKADGTVLERETGNVRLADPLAK